MATKSRNKLLKLLALVFLIIYGVSGVLTTVTSGGNYFKNYYQTEEFRQDFYQFVELLAMFELMDLSKEEVKEATTVTAGEIEEHRTRYGDLSTQIANIEKQYRYKLEELENEDLADDLRAERDEKIADITENFKNDDYVRTKILNEKEAQIDEYFEGIGVYRQQYNQYKDSFQYYFKETKTGKVYTNLDVTGDKPVEELLHDQNTNFIQYYTGYVPGEEHYIYSDYDENILAAYSDRSFEGVIGVLKSIPGNGLLSSLSSEYEQKQTRFLVFAITSLIAIILCWFLRGWARTPADLERNWVQHYEQIPLDVRSILAGITAMVVVISFMLISDSIYYFELGEMIIGMVLASLLLILLIFQGKWLLMVQQGDAKPEWKNREHYQQEWKQSLVGRSYSVLKESFLNRSIGVQMLVLLIGVFLLGACTVMVVIQPPFILVVGILLIAGVFSGITLLKFTGYFNKIIENTDELAAGRMGADLPVEGSSVLGRLAGNINGLKYGVKQSLNEQAKSERLKTELITNVSHDLRTPLTSIITYSELLKTPDLSEADREAYIEIIDRKSKRLKVLIDDLFEASKMASGNVELIKEQVDLVQLLQQALAEHNEAIENAGLQLRVATPEEAVYSIVDGQKLWRVFDNLIGNILKYSLENTRVYINLKQSEGKASITFKNVTKYELSENVEELYERFKRGDESRNTEGSGLGLAIAKSIVDLHQGEMDIEVDGDLFKVTITL